MRDDVMRRLREDRDAGRLGTLEAYRATFPDAGADLDLAYAAALAEGGAGAATSAGHPSGAGRAAIRTAIGLDALATASPDRLDVLEEIGRGGMGVVLEVEDRVLGRRLAMKRVNPAAETDEEPATGSSGPTLVRRLLEEAQVTAQLDHPGVVPVHELGVDANGRVFFTMKKVHGRTLERALEEGRTGEPWPLSRALQVFLRVCETLAYAHAKGVVHRDVKPANVMVGRFGEVYLMDWGLAKVRGDAPSSRDGRPAPGAASVVRTRRSDGVRSGSDAPLTMDGQMVGTVGYLPPEQLTGGPVDARADVYAVGAMLYELLAGHAPFREPDPAPGAGTFWERLLRGEPAPLAERAPHAPPELVSIATKALSRDPARRYPSASALADELHAFLEGRVVRSHRTGVWVEIRAWTRRNRRLALGLAAAALLAAGAVVAFVVQQRHAAIAIGEQRDLAVTESGRAKAAGRRSDGLRLAAQSSEALARDPGVALATAVEAARLAPGPEADGAIYRALRVHREVAYLAGHEGYVNGVRFLRDGRRLISHDESGIAILWDTEAAEGLRWFDAAGDAVIDLATSPDETWAAVAHADGHVRIESLAAPAPARVLDVRATSLQVAPDGAVLVAEAGGRVARWDPVGGAAIPLAEHGSAAWLATGAEAGAAFAASLGADGRVLVHDLGPGGGVRWSAADPTPVASGATPKTLWARISTRARRLLVRWPSGAVRLHDLEAGGIVGAEIPAPTLVDAAFSDDGRRLLLRTDVALGGGLETRDPTDGRLLGAFAVPRKTPVPSPDGSLVAFPGATVTEVYDVERGVERATLAGHRYHVRAAAWSPDGRRVATASHDGTVRVFEVRRASERDGLVERVRAGARLVDVSDAADAALLLVAPIPAAATCDLEVVDPASGAVRVRIEVPAESAERAAFAPSGDRLHVVEGATWSERDAATGRVLRSTVLAWPSGALPPGRAHPSPDGRRVAVKSGDELLVFDVATGALLSRFGEPGTFALPTWHPDGRRIALARGAARTTELVDTTDGRLLRTFRGHTGFAIGAAFDPDGRRLATCAVDSSIRVVDVESGTLLSRLTGLPMAGSTVAFGPDGRRIVHVSTSLVLVDAAPGTDLVERATLARGAEANALRLHPDGRRFWTSDDDGRIRLFELDALAAGERALARPTLAGDRVRFDAALALEPGAVAERFFRRADPWWTQLRAALLLSVGRVDEALEAARAASARRPGWPRPRLLAARALGASASRPGATAADRARLRGEAVAELDRAIASSLGDDAVGGGASVPAELGPFLDDAEVRARLERLGFSTDG